MIRAKNILFVLLVLVGCLLATARGIAQEASEKDGSISETETGTELYTRVFKIRPDFLSLGADAAPANDDPFAEDANDTGTGLGNRMTAQEILEARGITFPKGAAVFRGSVTSQLIIRNTAENLDRIGVFIEDEIKSSLPAQAGVLIELVELDSLAMSKLIRKHARADDFTAFRDELDGTIETGTAKLAASTYLVARSGQRAKVESILEHIYPTEFDPPAVNPKNDEEVAPAAAVAFDTQHVGLTLEMEAKIWRDSSQVELQLQVDRTRYLGEREYGEGSARISQPDFGGLSLNSIVVAKDGACVLVGTHTPLTVDGEPSERRQLVLATVSILSLGDGP